MKTTVALHQFDLRLCEYVRGNIAQHLIGRDKSLDLGVSNGRSNRGRVSPSAEYRNLSHPDRIAMWLYRNLDHRLWEFLDDDEQCRGKLLTQRELYELHRAIGDMSPPLPRLSWTPWPGLHREYVQCLVDLRRRLSPAAANAFAAMSERTGATLSVKQLPLELGIEAIEEWVREIRRLLQAMKLGDLLPSGEGGLIPTPTADDVPNELRLYVDRLRTKFAKEPALIDATKNHVVESVQGARLNLLRAIAYLEKRGEYRGPNATHASDEASPPITDK